MCTDSAGKRCQYLVPPALYNRANMEEKEHFIDFWHLQQYLMRIWDTHKSEQKLCVCFTSRNERGPMGKALVLPSVTQPMQRCCCRDFNCHSYKSVELLSICGNGNDGRFGRGKYSGFFPHRKRCMKQLLFCKGMVCN